MELRTSSHKGWLLVHVPDRVDALNGQAFVAGLKTLVGGRSSLALDLRHTQFLNYQTLRFIHEAALQVTDGGRRFALVAASEKMKRQFNLFASMEPFQLLSWNDWIKMHGPPVLDATFGS
jgi:anti-anti-sigma regulatory factor